jgi:hypothetical protein
MSPQLRRAGLPTLILTAALLGRAAPAAAQGEQKTLAGDRVAIFNLVGRLRVQPSTGAQVTVDITRGGADAAQLKIETGELRGQNTLRVVYPSDRIVYRGDERWNSSYRTNLHVNADGTFGMGENGRFWDRGNVEIRSSGSGLDAYADLTVSVPKGQRIELHLGVGDATITNVEGDIFVDVAAARVEAQHTKGRLTLDTGSGGVTVNDAQGEVSLDTGSGGVNISAVRGTYLRMDTGSGSIRGSDIDVRELDADVGSGGLRLTGVKSPRVTLDAGSGGVELELLADVDDVRIDVGSGGVTLRIPSSLGAEIDVETGSGGIDTEIPVQMTRVERNHLRGTIGDGRGRIRIESGSGRVKLAKGM